MIEIFKILENSYISIIIASQERNFVLVISVTIFGTPYSFPVTSFETPFSFPVTIFQLHTIAKKFAEICFSQNIFHFRKKDL